MCMGFIMYRFTEPTRKCVLINWSPLNYIAKVHSNQLTLARLCVWKEANVKVTQLTRMLGLRLLTENVAFMGKDSV